MTTAFPATTQVLARQIAEARIDHAAFEILLRPCEMSRCKATCCHDGVHLSSEEAVYVRGLTECKRGELESLGFKIPEEVIIKSPDRKGEKTAVREALEYELAVDFPEHFPKTRCVFLDEGGYCGLQKLAMQEGSHAWKHKPLTCWMHPLVLVPAGKWEERPVLTMVNAENDPQKKEGYAGYASCTHCGREDKSGSPAWQVLQAELRMLGELCGRDIYNELSAPTVDWVRE